MKLGSLFSGIGGFEKGAEMLGIETLWSCDIEEHNRKVLAKHFPNTRIYKDIRELCNVGPVDIIAGGFPCQDISISQTKNKDEHGNIKGINGERSGLWSEMWRIISEVRPQYVIIENSPMLLVRGWERVINDLSKIGYCVEWQCLQARQFGFEHKRTRLYAIAYPVQKRCLNNTSIFRRIPEVLSKRPSGQISLPVPIKRINSRTDFTELRVYDGFSRELDKISIGQYGNAVIPDIAAYLFYCILQYEANRRIHTHKTR
jgi:DNA (cytosine-5)-methyltransferase 1